MVKHTQFVGNLPTNCLSVFDHFVILALKGLTLSATTAVTGLCSIAGNSEVFQFEVCLGHVFQRIALCKYFK